MREIPKKSIPLNGNASRYATLVFPSPSGIDALSAQCKLHVRHLPASTITTRPVVPLPATIIHNDSS